MDSHRAVAESLEVRHGHFINSRDPFFMLTCDFINAWFGFFFFSSSGSGAFPDDVIIFNQACSLIGKANLEKLRKRLIFKLVGIDWLGSLSE